MFLPPYFFGHLAMIHSTPIAAQTMVVMITGSVMVHTSQRQK
jgi:hypothetical protein